MLRNCKQILAIAIISAGVSGAAIIPNIISAQSSIPKTAAVVTAQNQKPEQPPFNLTDAQKQQFKTLNEKTSKLIQDVLTPEQQATFTAELKKGDRNVAWKSLNLSKEQKDKIIAINKGTAEKRLAILNPEQRSQLAKNQKSDQNPLNLTNAQKQLFKTLNEKTSKLIQDVLTPEQQATFTADLKKGDRSAAWKAIKLSREQKKRITEINKSDNEKKLTILTAEQRSQLAKRSVSVSQ